MFGDDSERAAWDEHYAEMEAAKAQLAALIPGLRVTSSGGMCPFQAEGLTPDGEEFYFRYRHDNATLYVFPRGREHWNCRLYAEALGAMLAGWDRGYLDGKDFVALFVRLWGRLRPREECADTRLEQLRAVMLEAGGRVDSHPFEHAEPSAEGIDTQADVTAP